MGMESMISDHIGKLSASLWKKKFRLRVCPTRLARRFRRLRYGEAGENRSCDYESAMNWASVEATE